MLKLQGLGFRPPLMTLLGTTNLLSSTIYVIFEVSKTSPAARVTTVYVLQVAGPFVQFLQSRTQIPQHILILIVNSWRQRVIT